MIPLSQWLAVRENPGPAGASPPAAEDPDECAGIAVASLVVESYARGRQDERAEMLASMEALRFEQESALARLEADLNARWESLVSADLSGLVTKAFDDLRHALEASICEVLRPFLDEAVVRNAAEQLIGHVRAEACRSAAPIIGIRSPALLHPRLEKLLSEKDIAVSLSDGDVIEVTAKDGTSRFESMAGRWITLLHEGET